MLFDGDSSAEEIAASLRCSKRTVHRALAALNLAEGGLIWPGL
ncbi:HTH domain-containing protein [Mycobacteroides abscessus]|nr:HTH domain-containing protein [Mycobacteroides abscessus]MDM2179963.1 HTH domain-containing protein [Mycobacteroides abscessus]MDM2206856.1 HTH domain-containing protein [Mycobacteroides abscessus]MDM2209950.1 HTH domain-containing protein [Mycobacteroides abscessus]MDM2217132.1 HTH domain-containing protein [Mycobacteroides abscessus]